MTKQMKGILVGSHGKGREVERVWKRTSRAHIKAVAKATPEQSICTAIS
jgi:hypothetical protein